MATVTYSWAQVVGAYFMNDVITAGDQSQPAIVSLSGGGYFGLWSRTDLEFVRANVAENDGTLVSAEFGVNTTGEIDQFDPSGSQLANGNVVVTFTDTSSGASTVRARLFQDDGTSLGNDFVVATNGSEELSQSDVTALETGFAVSFTSEAANGDLDICVQRFNANGTPNGSLIQVDNLSTADASASAISSFAIGFVVTYTREGTGGDEIWYRLYNSDGTLLSSPLPLDDFGSINADVQVTELANGGFVVVYTDNGWSEDGTTDITAQVFSASGGPQGDPIRVNIGSVFTGNQDKPSVTALPNGFFVVSWVDEASHRQYEQAFDANGNPVGDDFVVSGQVIDGEIATLSNGTVADVRSSTLSDGDGDSIRSSVTELTRTTTATVSGETLTGDDLKDVMFGQAGNNTLKGFGGADFLIGGSGADRMEGGTGDDRYGVDHPGDTVIEAAGAGDDEVQTTVSFNLSVSGQNVESLFIVIGADIDGTGNDLGNQISGGSGRNTLQGLGGDDVLYGAQGDDILKGGTGADFLTGGSGIDTADYGDKTAALVVTLDGSNPATVTVGGVAEDTIREIENVTGGSAGDTLTGDNLANLLNGGGGNDLLQSGNGNDVLKGGAGGDTLNGGGDVDTADYRDKTSAVVVTLNGGHYVTVTVGGVAEDSIKNIENVYGGSAGDTLTGDSLANLLFGGRGNDTLTGAAGTDAFLFNATLNAVTNLDHITDFVSGETIRLENSVFTALTTNGTLASSAFYAAAGATSGHDSTDRIVYNTTNGALYYDADGNQSGGVAAIEFAVLDGHPALTNADLVVV